MTLVYYAITFLSLPAENIGKLYLIFFKLFKKGLGGQTHV